MEPCLDELRYRDKVTIVTGGSKGIGEGIVREFGTSMLSRIVIHFYQFYLAYKLVTNSLAYLKKEQTLSIKPEKYKLNCPK